MRAANWRIALGLLRTEWRSGALPLLLLALVLAVSTIAGLGAFSQRLHAMLQGEASHMLAADRVLEAPRPIPPSWLQQATALGARSSQVLEFQSMIYPAGADLDAEPLLISAKAADANYPLLGQILSRPSSHAAIARSSHGPAVGEIWLEARALQLLGLQIGDAIELGHSQLTISALLIAEPDRAAGSFSLGPRALLHWDDMQASGVVQPGSRLQYRYLFSADAAVLSRLDQHFAPRIGANQRWLDLATAQPPLAKNLDRAEQFLRLASAMAIVLAGLTMATAAAHFAQSQIATVAILKTLGASARRIQGIYARLLLLLGAAATSLACLLAYGFQHAAIAQAQRSLEVPPPALSPWPFLLGLAVALLALLSLVGPALYALKHTSALSLLQARLHALRYFSLGKLTVVLLGLLAILLLYTQAPRLTALLLLGLLALVAVIALGSYGLLHLLRQRTWGLHGAAALAGSNLLRRMRSNSLHMALFASSGMLAVTLWGLQHQLFAQWQNQLPANTPNYFAINIAEDDVPATHRWLETHLGEAPDLYPIVRARWTHINGQTLSQRASTDTLEQAGVQRELNLSWAENLPEHNELVAGRWWHTDNRAHGVSIESKLAERLGVQLGDTLGFQHESQHFEAQVTSIRRLDWERMTPNFFLLFTPEQLWDYPKTYIGSFYLAPEQQALSADFVRQFPQAVLIDLAATIAQIRQLTQHIGLALQLVLALVLFGSLLLFISTVQSSLSERRYENTILRALGLSQKRLSLALTLEFAAIGILAGGLASLFAQLTLLALQHYLLALPLQLSPSLWWPAPLIGGLLTASAGLISAWRITQTAPMQALRHA